MSVSKRLRYEILRRDNFQCRYCGAAAPDVKLNVDHVIPKSLGGSDKPDNLVTSCADCNAGKTSSMPNAMVVADVNQEVFRLAAARRRDAIALHLQVVWTQAFEETGRGPSELDRMYFVEHTRRALACGLSGRVDLMDAARRAGLDISVDIQSYLTPPHPPLSRDEARFLDTVAAVDVWESEWDYATVSGAPTSDQVDAFIDAVGAALDDGHAPAAVLEAARMAGRATSLDLPMHLSRLIASGGGL